MATLREVFKDIADAIREKGVSGTMKPIEMASKIETIQTGDAPMSGLPLKAYGFEVVNRNVVGPSERPERYDLVVSGLTTATYGQFNQAWGIQGSTGVGIAVNACKMLPSIATATFPNLTKVEAQSFGSAFAYNKSIQSVSFPALTTIAGSEDFSYAFNGTNIQSVSFPNKLTCTSTSLGSVFYYSFYDCTSLTSIPRIDLNMTAAKSLTKTFYYCFYGCTGLTSIQEVQDFINKYDQYAGQSAFSNCFAQCTGLKGEIEFNLTHEFAGSSATYQSTYKMLANCTGLTKAIVHSTTTYMADIFYGCTGLTEVVIDTLTSINGSSMADIFTNCSKLAKITFQDVTSMSSMGTSVIPATGILTKELHMNSLTSITGSTSAGTSNPCYWMAYGYCTKLYFPAVTNITGKFLFGAATYSNRIQEIHFAASNQAAIEATAGYDTKWGATNATIYFDL